MMKTKSARLSICIAVYQGTRRAYFNSIITKAIYELPEEAAALQLATMKKDGCWFRSPDPDFQ